MVLEKLPDRVAWELRRKSAAVTLEEIADERSSICHAFFGMPGALNKKGSADISAVDQDSISILSSAVGVHRVWDEEE